MALVIKRKAGEAIQVGDATITVHSVKGGTVRLAIDAPADVRITRPDYKGGDKDGEPDTKQSD